MISYETQRIYFERIVAKYKEYLAIYAFFNGGSTEGCTEFADFYWEQHFYTLHNFDLKLNRGF